MKSHSSSKKSIKYNDTSLTEGAPVEQVESTKRKKSLKYRNSRRKLIPAASLRLVNDYILEVVEDLRASKRELNSPGYSDAPDGVNLVNCLVKQPPHPTSSQSAFISNWTNADELLKCFDFPAAVDAYAFSLKKPEIYPTQFSSNGAFLEDIGIVTMAEISNLGALLYCRPNMKKKDGWKCSRFCFCHYCSYLRFSRENNRLTESFDQYAGEALYCYTLSWNQPIPLNNDLEVALMLWDVLEAAVREAHADALYSGLFFSKELAVTAFLPSRGFPHAHGFFFAPLGGVKISQTLGEMVTRSEAWKTLTEMALIPRDFSPNFDVQVSTSPEGCRNWLFYSLKVFSVAERYKEVFAAISPSLRLSLNNEVEDIVTCYDLEMGRSERGGGVKPLYRVAGRVLRLGNLHWSCRQKVVTAKARWKDDDHIDLRNTIRRQALVNAREQNDAGGNI